MACRTPASDRCAGSASLGKRRTNACSTSAQPAVTRDDTRSAANTRGIGRTIRKRLDAFRPGVAAPNDCIKVSVLEFAPAQGRRRNCYETQMRFCVQLPQGRSHTHYGTTGIAPDVPMTAKKVEQSCDHSAPLPLNGCNEMHRIPAMSSGDHAA